MTATYLTFSYNWNNKLYCNAYTTIRLWQEDKFIIGSKLNVWMQKAKSDVHELQHTAEIVSVKKLTLDQISNELCLIDTGYTKPETIGILKNMYKHKNIDVQKVPWAIVFLKKVKE